MCNSIISTTSCLTSSGNFLWCGKFWLTISVHSWLCSLFTPTTSKCLPSFDARSIMKEGQSLRKDLQKMPFSIFNDRWADLHQKSKSALLVVVPFSLASTFLLFPSKNASEAQWIIFESVCNGARRFRTRTFNCTYTLECEQNVQIKFGCCQLLIWELFTSIPAPIIDKWFWTVQLESFF